MDFNWIKKKLNHLPGKKLRIELSKLLQSLQESLKMKNLYLKPNL